jgi:cytosine permease
MTRYNRSAADVVKQTLVGVTLGEYVIGLIGVLLAHALRTDNVTAIITTTSGAFGTLILIASILKINDWNLYSGGLGLVNAINVLSGRKVSRVHVTLAIGIVGSFLAAAGILNHFTTFLDELGVLIPPVAGIMIAEYFVVKQWRGDLDEARERGELPAHAPEWVPAGLAAWLAGWAMGKFLNWGVPALNALIVAVVVYVILGKLGLVRRLAR